MSDQDDEFTTTADLNEPLDLQEPRTRPSDEARDDALSANRENPMKFSFSEGRSGRSAQYATAREAAREFADADPAEIPRVSERIGNAVRTVAHTVAVNNERGKSVPSLESVLSDSANVGQDGVAKSQMGKTNIAFWTAFHERMKEKEQVVFAEPIILQEPLSESLVAPDPDVKMPDRDDRFSRPMGFDDRFVVTHRAIGQDLYRSYDDKRPAIEDQGDILKTKNADRATAMDMVQLVAHRGWSKMNVKGPEEFRREFWIEGAAQGIEVKGYRPSDKDRAEADRRAELVGYRIVERADGQERKQTTASQSSGQKNTASMGGKNDKDNVVELPNYDKGVSGTISGIGNAPYMGREGASSTPFVTLDLADGRSHKLWGVGLPSMIADNGLNVGDKATITSAGKKAVTVEKTDEKTGEIKQIDTYRREWAATDITRAQIKTASEVKRPEIGVKQDEPQPTKPNRATDNSLIESADKVRTPLDLSRKEPLTARDEPQSGKPDAVKDKNLAETSHPRGSPDRATELEDRMKSSQAGRDPVVQGAASRLSLMEAELKAQGVDREDINNALSNARTQMSRELASGKKIPVERLANVTRKQEHDARKIVRTERSRTIERERGEPDERTPSR